MPAKKKKGTKKPSSKKSPTTVMVDGYACTLQEVCRNLKKLHKWMSPGGGFYEDYKRLRKAMCHLERVVIDGRAVDPSLRFCSGGGGGAEPPDPPPPPPWT